MSDDFNLDNLDRKSREFIERTIADHGGESDSKKNLRPLPNKKPEYDHTAYSRDALWAKREMLEEHLGVLEESLLWAINDVEIFEKKMELNPAKREELVQAVDNIGQEIDMVRTELADLERHL
jgi:hypothetical protein